MIEHIFFALGTVNSIKIYDKNSKNYEPLLKHIQERMDISHHIVISMMTRVILAILTNKPGKAMSQ